MNIKREIKQYKKMKNMIVKNEQDLQNIIKTQLQENFDCIIGIRIEDIRWILYINKSLNSKEICEVEELTGFKLNGLVNERTIFYFEIM